MELFVFFEIVIFLSLMLNLDIQESDRNSRYIFCFFIMFLFFKRLYGVV